MKRSQRIQTASGVVAAFECGEDGAVFVVGGAVGATDVYVVLVEVVGEDVAGGCAQVGKACGALG
ncbi:hypothetical protein GCM10007147_10730 [Nocardiopsis kunsanensis]|uniref:Uncharacterized protein n=1 Tax=Nocardiopsis kunsanensis TaxID=141693 RepID=A0A919CGU3_9ACTN|nr:hypothetical protein GCM10007147_10730 [Nocardiopsis kunsanensis]